MKRWSRMIAIAGVVAALGAAGVSAQTAGMKIASREYLLLGNVTRGAGEPMLAVDPTNSNNIVVIGMGSLNRIGAAPVTHGMTSAYWGVSHSTEPSLAVTHNGGRTWKVGVLPIMTRELSPDHLPFERCPDPFAAVNAQGVFFIGCEPRESHPDKQGYYPGGSYFLISKDKGNSWSKVPTPVITSWSLSRFAPGLKPRVGGVASPWDRPFIKIDNSTGILYGQAGGGQTDLNRKPGDYRTQSYITSSSNGGQSFGTIYSWDSPQYPELSRGSFDVANGVLGVVYAASRVPASLGAACPCVVFGASQDRGKSFQYHLIPNVPVATSVYRAQGFAAARGGAGGGRGGHGGAGGRGGLFPGARGAGGLDIAADPTHRGRFDVMVSTLHRLLVSETDDSGASWSSWVPAAVVPGTEPTKPWITYSAEGVLGIMWRAIRSDGTYVIYATISRDSGRSFSPPVRISHQASPAGYPNRDDGMFGDDIQDLVVGRSQLRMVWGDSRSGFLGSWYGEVPMSAFAAPAQR